MTEKTVQDVRRFWESQPLFTGETSAEPGSAAFFQHHRDVYISDCFAGELDERLFPAMPKHAKVLDLGCGPGFWTENFALRDHDITGADLTGQAVELARKRLLLAGKPAAFAQQNAESLGFRSGAFDHVNCQGVIHHTPRPAACVAEIARVLKPGGTAVISVYFRNIFLKAWPVLRYAGKALAWLGGGLRGRGRESIFALENTDEIVRLYDGRDNPIGISFDRAGFVAMLEPHFVVQETYLHFFPARALPFRVPGFLHRALDKHAGFLIFASLRKR